MNKNFSLYKKGIAPILMAIALIASPTEIIADTIVGHGVTPQSGTSSSGVQSYGIDASQLTLQQIADANGGWAWVDVDGDGIAERYYFLSASTYLINGMTPDGNYVNAYGQWTVNGRVLHRASADQDAVNQAALRASTIHGDSFSGIYSGAVQFTGGKKKYYTIEVTQKSILELEVLYSDDVGVVTYTYEYAGPNEMHPGVTMWKATKNSNGEYLLFYGYNSIVYYNYDGSLAGQLVKIG